MRSLILAVLLFVAGFGSAQELDWEKLGAEAERNLTNYLRLDTSNPPAETMAAARFLKGLLEKEGLAVTVYESQPGKKANVLARLPGTGRHKPVLLLNHMDVVPVDRERWTVDPFGGLVRDGRIWGRGSMDMKSLGMIQLMALVALKRAGFRPDRDILFLATADEETGGELGAGWMIQNHFDQLSPEYVLDEGGFGARDVLSDGRLVYGISVADKRSFWIRAVAAGSSGHGSQPIADNANELLVDALGRILARPQPASEIAVVKAMRERVGNFADNKFTNAIQRNTCSLTSLRAGVGDPPKVNVIPSRSEATLDCRLLPGQSPEELLARLRSLGGDPRVRLEVIRVAEAAPPSRWDTPLFRAMERVLLRQSDTAVVAPILVPYGTDGSKFRARGATVYGFAPMIVDLDVLSSMHSDQERISAAEFRRGLRIFYEILQEFTGGK